MGHLWYTRASVPKTQNSGNRSSIPADRTSNEYRNNMNLNLTTKTRFAEMAGVSQAAITKACKNKLAPALHGKKINLSHPSAAEYLFQKGKITKAPADVALKMPPPPKPRGHAAKNKRRRAESLDAIETGRTLHEIPADIQNFLHMTLKELIDRFGTEYAFLDWLKATKQIEDINEKRLKNAQTAGELVHRDLVKRGIIDPIDASHRQLLTDGVKTISKRCVALHDAGEPLDAIEAFVLDQVSSFIRPVKAKIKRLLKDLMENAPGN